MAEVTKKGEALSEEKTPPLVLPVERVALSIPHTWTVGPSCLVLAGIDWACAVGTVLG